MKNNNQNVRERIKKPEFDVERGMEETLEEGNFLLL
jgi:hypothetical protein